MSIFKDKFKNGKYKWEEIEIALKQRKEDLSKYKEEDLRLKNMINEQKEKLRNLKFKNKEI